MDRDSSTSWAIVDRGGVVVIVTHTVNAKSLSATSAVVGTLNFAAAKIDGQFLIINLSHKIIMYHHYQ